jgi:hypothetical protein
MGTALLDFSEVQEVGDLKPFRDRSVTRKATILSSCPRNNRPAFIFLVFIVLAFIIPS